MKRRIAWHVDIKLRRKSAPQGISNTYEGIRILATDETVLSFGSQAPSSASPHRYWILLILIKGISGEESARHRLARFLKLDVNIIRRLLNTIRRTGDCPTLQTLY